jgi:hypothetical protein
MTALILRNAATRDQIPVALHLEDAVQFPADIKFKVSSPADTLAFGCNYPISRDPAVKVIGYLTQPSADQPAGCFAGAKPADDDDSLIIARVFGGRGDEIEAHHYAFAVGAGQATRLAVGLRILCGLDVCDKY